MIDKRVWLFALAIISGVGTNAEEAQEWNWDNEEHVVAEARLLTPPTIFIKEGVKVGIEPVRGKCEPPADTCDKSAWVVCHKPDMVYVWFAKEEEGRSRKVEFKYDLGKGEDRDVVKRIVTEGIVDMRTAGPGRLRLTFLPPGAPSHLPSQVLDLALLDDFVKIVE